MSNIVQPESSTRLAWGEGSLGPVVYANVPPLQRTWSSRGREKHQAQVFHSKNSWANNMLSKSACCWKTKRIPHKHRSQETAARRETECMPQLTHRVKQTCQHLRKCIRSSERETTPKSQLENPSTRPLKTQCCPVKASLGRRPTTTCSMEGSKCGVDWARSKKRRARILH